MFICLVTTSKKNHRKYSLKSDKIIGLKLINQYAEFGSFPSRFVQRLIEILPRVLNWRSNATIIHYLPDYLRAAQINHGIWHNSAVYILQKLVKTVIGKRKVFLKCLYMWLRTIFLPLTRTTTKCFLLKLE